MKAKPCFSYENKSCDMGFLFSQTATAEGGGGAVPAPHGPDGSLGCTASPEHDPTPGTEPRARPCTGCEMSAPRCALGAVVPPLSTASPRSPARKMSPAEGRRPPTTPRRPEGGGVAGRRLPFPRRSARRELWSCRRCGRSVEAGTGLGVPARRGPWAEGQRWERRQGRQLLWKVLGLCGVCWGTGAPHFVFSPSAPFPAVRAVCPGGWRCPGCGAGEGRVWCGSRALRPGRRAARPGLHPELALRGARVLFPVPVPCSVAPCIPVPRDCAGFGAVLSLP